INLMKKLEETNEHLQKEKEQSSKLASIGEKMSQMSHNMRNPLHVIMMNAELANMASKNDGNEKMIEKSEAIKKAADSMLAQIEDLMNFIRDETLKLQKKSLNEILNDAASLVKKPDTIEIQLPEKDIICKCDPHKIQVVFMNLFTNAIEAMENVGKITVRTKETGKNVIIEVENSGESISSDVMPRIFDPLFTTKKRGTGLGLPYCKNVIEQHGGTISVNPNPTVFTITLPK
ncbi:MAG: HAMP domain-containing sensor histidine kinase, partial [Nitrosotalea sp.]